MRTRIAFRLALGILFGVILVLLPGVFLTTPSPLSPATSATNSNGWQFGPARITSGQSEASPAAGINGLSFFTIVAFILLPSVIFSLIARRWVERRARDYSGEIQIDQ